MQHFPKLRHGCAVLLAALAMAGLPAVAGAQNAPASTAASSENMTVPLYKSRVLRLEAPAARVSVGNPDIADILILRATQLYVLGKDLGTTNVLLWDRNDQLIGTVSVEVTQDLDSLKAKLYELLPGEDIKVYAAQRSLVLSGRVSSTTAMSAALQLANGYLAQVSTAVKSQQFEQQGASKRPDKAVGEIINLMEVAGSQQVMLSVKVAEIDRTELRRLDARWNGIFKGSDHWTMGGVNGGAQFPQTEFTDFGNARLPAIDGPMNSPFGPDVVWGPAVTEFSPTTPFIEDKGLFATFVSDDILLSMTLDAAKDKGLAKILAEPTLTTLSGQEAQFLSGGEFPIPVPQGDNGIAVEFKEFGVGLKFLPMVLTSRHINLKTNVSVSELVQTNDVVIRADDTLNTFIVPSLRKRSANATVELKDGQTIGIAGLINESLRESVRKFPMLGDMPVIGPLFRSQDFLKGETELVILVTPRLAKPLAPDQIKLPTDNFVEPSEKDFFLHGRLEGKAKEKKPAETSEQVAGGTEGSYGPQVQ